MERTIRADDSSFRFLNPAKLWRSRTILFFLVRRDTLVTYKQTILGVFWTVLKPLVLAFIIVFLFSRIGKFPNYGLPYILIALGALCVWEFFSNSISRGTRSIVDDRELITKVNFPRIILPLNASIRNTIGFYINLLVTISLMVFYEIPFTTNLLLIPLIYLATVLFNLALGLWLSTIDVFYRDVETLVPFVLRVGLFVSPVAFSLRTVPEKWQALYCLNPLVGIIESMRFCLLGPEFKPGLDCILLGALTLVLLLVSGLYFFGKFERKFADVI